MTFEDKKIICEECQTEFVWTVEEQEFFKTKGYTNDPRRCPSCRHERRINQGRQYEVVCAEDGCSTIVNLPFKPKADGKYYCKSHYVKPIR
jgi:CxxC-x17-CxxC domain-containing protein